MTDLNKGNGVSWGAACELADVDRNGVRRNKNVTARRNCILEARRGTLELNSKDSNLYEYPAHEGDNKFIGKTEAHGVISRRFSFNIWWKILHIK